MLRSAFERLALVIVAAVTLTRSAAAEEVPLLSSRLGEAPFCYVSGGVRDWPLLSRALLPGESVRLTARGGDKTLAQGDSLKFAGLAISVNEEGNLQIEARNNSSAAFRLEIEVLSAGKSTAKRTIAVRAAPPDRPISYVSDLVDDLIHHFWDGQKREFRPFTKPAFDQYFRRLQAHGVNRLIVWQCPFPLINDPANYDEADWRNYERQVHAILNCSDLTASMRETAALKSYQWLSMMMAARLTPEFGRLYSQSAVDHGIRLSASFRPFEPALTKYYGIPAFNLDGSFLWEFLPHASPIVNYHADDVAFANYRDLLRRMDRTAEATIRTIRIDDVPEAARLAARLQSGELKLDLLASPVPPIDESSYVLVRDGDDSFELQPFSRIRDRFESNLTRIDDLTFRADGDRLIIDDVRVPEAARFLILRCMDENAGAIRLPVLLDMTIRSQAGNRLGRVNVYAAHRGESPEARSTRVVGIPRDGMYRTTFQAIENSIDLFRKTKTTTFSLKEADVVIDLGEQWSVEMTDFVRPAARAYAVRQLKTILANKAFDEIFVNTRSHTQLAGSTGDGVDGVRPMAHYRLSGKNYFHYGIDRAFAPLSVADDPQFRLLPTEAISAWQDGEWQRPCDSSDSPFKWRLHRNRAIARGVRMLLQDLERAFPDTRIRAVIPHNRPVIAATEAALDRMPKPDGGVFGRKYFRHIWGSLNYIPAIGEGMSMIDLSGSSVEPVFLGLRFRPDAGPRQLFVDQYIQQLKSSHGSSYRGPKSFFYEAQETLRGARAEEHRKHREEIICELLRREDHIREVILYEAADWTSYLPLNDPDRCGYYFLDRCPK